MPLRGSPSEPILETVGVSVSGFPAKLDLVPGVPTVCEIGIRNTGTLVDDLTVELLGEAASFGEIVPRALQLLPGTQGSVQVRLQPPLRPSPRAGPLPAQLRVVSKADPGGSATGDTVLAVSAFGDVRAELVPRNARGFRSAPYTLTVSNQGNDVIVAQVSARDPDEALAFESAPPTVTVEPTSEAKVVVRARARKWHYVGRPQSRPFEATVEDPRWPPVTREGVFVHKPLVPWWLVPLLPILLLVAVGVLSNVNRGLLAAVVVVLGIVVLVLRRRTRPKQGR